MLIVLGLVAFIIEFAFMVGVFMLGSGVVGGGFGGLVVGVLAVVLVAALWGMFIAPRARRRIPKLPRALASGGAVALVGAGLLGLDHTRFGLVLIGAGLVLVLAQLALDESVPTRPQVPPGDTRRERNTRRRR
ncbi:hypothetical protein JNB_08859 [Janibacter sp. HTCC2649]|uniref:DUF2568 domain-containing protein n=1 Tax=Janibacter sp. HTCC2649 TaxID=313589 RepID=UPI0000670C0C|nr:DUF2568 domain-containing protein [Janibacter sp. HTCC2649]EAQ00269.1 hypothetical protein JNB_08859 [Janibacter sp. HTCC2649]